MPRKTQFLYARVTPYRMSLYLESAARDGLKISEWVRMLADRRITELLPPTHG